MPASGIFEPSGAIPYLCGVGDESSHFAIVSKHINEGKAFFYHEPNVILAIAQISMLDQKNIDRQAKAQTQES